MISLPIRSAALITACAINVAALAQEGDPAPTAPSPESTPATGAPQPPPDRQPEPQGPPPFGPDGPRDARPMGGMRGGPGGPMREEVKLVEKFDANKNGRLELDERKEARASLAKDREEGGRGGRMRGPGGPGGGPFGGRGNQAPPEPGIKLTPEEVPAHRATPLYDTQTLRTLFLEIESPDWEKELMEFHGTDVEVPATMVVDGKTYEDVGVHFRGASSFMMVGEGRKHSLNLSIDFVHEKQDLRGYRTLNLLNSAGDPTFLRAVLYNQIAREYIPAPKANWVRVAINGENWGVFVNVQQFNKDFVEEWFGTKKGARWKAPGRPNGNSGLEYLGDDVAEYRKRYEIKSKDDAESWQQLIELCRVLNQTPAEELEAKLSPLLNIDGVLKFLALENVFINTDGYWTRASDYNLYRDGDGRFHVIPHDVNETFRAPEGRGGRRGGNPQEAGGEPQNPVALSPLAGADDARKPLLSKLLAVPALRERYLGYVREIATKWLDWEKLGPMTEQYQALIADEVERDTKKLASFEEFRTGVTGGTQEEGARGGRQALPLKTFVEQRRAYLLGHPDLQAAGSSSRAL